MRLRMLLATSLMAATISATGSFAQSSDIGANALSTVQLVVEAPKIANRQSVQDIVEELTVAGFTIIEIHRTFLGRARIVAYSATQIREVIINPTTGEVLRDLAHESVENPTQQANAHANAHAASSNGNKGGNSNGQGNGSGNSNNGNNGNAGGGNGN